MGVAARRSGVRQSVAWAMNWFSVALVYMIPCSPFPRASVRGAARPKVMLPSSHTWYDMMYQAFINDVHFVHSPAWPLALANPRSPQSPLGAALGQHSLTFLHINQTQTHVISRGSVLCEPHPSTRWRGNTAARHRGLSPWGCPCAAGRAPTLTTLTVPPPPPPPSPAPVRTAAGAGAGGAAGAAAAAPLAGC